MKNNFFLKAESSKLTDFMFEGLVSVHCFSVTIKLTSPCNIDPLTPHFYIVKLGCKGVCIFIFFALEHGF